MKQTETFLHRQAVLDYLQAKADSALLGSPEQIALLSAQQYISALDPVSFVSAPN